VEKPFSDWISSSVLENLDISKIPNILVRDDGKPVARILIKDQS